MKKISDSTIQRLSKYLRTLEMLEIMDVLTISSGRIAQIEQITSSQVRKDLSFFGSFGRRGLGYNVISLKKKIQGILGVNRPWNVAVVGVGNLGTALIDYNEMRRRKFNIRCIFDNDPAKIGSTIKGLVVQDVSALPKSVKEYNLQIGIITVPIHAAQQVADMLTAAGVRGILTFAPKTLTVPPGIFIQTEDTTTPLETLAYHLSKTRTIT